MIINMIEVIPAKSFVHVFYDGFKQIDRESLYNEIQFHFFLNNLIYVFIK